MARPAAVPGSLLLAPIPGAPEHAVDIRIQDTIALSAALCRTIARSACAFGARLGKRKNIIHLSKGVQKDARAGESLSGIYLVRDELTRQPVARRGAGTYEHPDTADVQSRRVLSLRY